MGVLVGAAAGADDRPEVRELRLSEGELLARFTPEVRGSRTLGERAIALWRSHFEAEARAIEGRFRTEADWRPAFADAAALVDEFLDASELPRVGTWRAEAGKVWVEKLDPRTGRRVRELQPAPRPVMLLAPQDGVPKAEPKPARPERRK